MVGYTSQGSAEILARSEAWEFLDGLVFKAFFIVLVLFDRVFLLVRFRVHFYYFQGITMNGSKKVHQIVKSTYQKQNQVFLGISGCYMLLIFLVCMLVSIASGTPDRKDQIASVGGLFGLLSVSCLSIVVIIGVNSDD
jgi:hypothetical protein